MAQSPGPFDPKSLLRASIVGVVLAVLGIALFIALWVALGSAGIGDAPRLFVSLCVPPLAIAAVLAVYYLIARRRV